MALPQPRPRPQPGAWTYEDYCALPDDGRRYEVIEGKLYMVPGPSWAHQLSAGRLYGSLDAHVRQWGLGIVAIAPFDVVLSKRNVFQPDVLFISRERMEVLTPANAWGSPDLAVEVLSPGTRRRDRGVKREVYVAHGVPHYWVIDPVARTLEAYELRDGVYVLVTRLEGDATFTPALFPGLVISLRLLWEPW